MASKKPRPPRSIGREMNIAAGIGSSVANGLLAPHGLSLAQWAVMMSIWRNGVLSVKELAELTGNTSPATSRIVDRMVKSGLLVRKQDTEDRRAVVVDVSEQGADLQKLQSVYQEVNQILLGDLTPEEAEHLFRLLEKVQEKGRNWLDQNDPRKGPVAEELAG